MMKISLSGKGWGDFGKDASPPASMKVRMAMKEALKRTAMQCIIYFKENVESGGTMVGAAFERNAPMTIRIKGFDKPLIDRREMINAFQANEQSELSYFMGWTNGREMEKAMFNEVGGLASIDGRIVFVPARPFVRPFIESTDIHNRLQTKFVQEMNKLMRLS